MRCSIKLLLLLCNDEHDIEVPVRVSANLPVHQVSSISISRSHVANRILIVYSFFKIVVLFTIIQVLMKGLKC